MNKKAQSALEFNKITERLSEYAKNDSAAERARSLEPQSDYITVRESLEQTDAATGFSLKFGSPEIPRINPVTEQMKRLALGGALSAAELLNFAAILRGGRNLSKYSPEQTGALSGYFESLYSDKQMEERITSAIISEDEIADGASPALANIRRKARSAGERIKSSLDSMIRSAHYKKFLQDPIVTMRQGRYVVPVRAEHRGDVAGIVHDVSASGGTVFIEPSSVVNANNELHELEIKERAETERILAELSNEASLVSEQIKCTYDALIEIDFAFAKARFALDINAVMPKINQSGRIVIKRGRHPLIDKKSVVPIDVTLGVDFDSLIVTGPNTGGKTVVLKTIGLFCLMTQAGLLIPAADGSEISVFKEVFADIGDEQSIEQSLSTFSAHMKNIVEIVGKAGDGTLVLFDELGAGTDPVEGAALATAVLEYVRGRGAKCACTTHYSELKLYALSTEGVQNGACEFDVETLSPTYRLLVGVPGKSNAFAISSRLGLSEDIIDRARDMLSDESVKFEDVLSSIEENRAAAEEAKRIQEEARREIEMLRAELKREREKITLGKDKIYDRARQKAEKIITGAREEVERMLEEIRRAQTEAEAAEARRVIGEVKRELDLKRKKNVPPASRGQKKKRGDVNINTLLPGQEVIISDLGDRGSVISVNKKDETVLVQVGIMKITSEIKNLELASPSKEKPSYTASAPRHSRGLMREAAKSEVDLRGLTLEEALDKTDKFLDDAVLGGLSTVSIIHGKGTGVLRSGIQDMLRRHPHVKSYRLGRYGEGENGVTIAELK